MIVKLRRKIERATKRIKEMESRHKGNEQDFTYHAGFDLGYAKGRLSVLEDLLDEEEN